MKKSHTSATHRKMKMMQMVVMLLCHLLAQRNMRLTDFQRVVLNKFEILEQIEHLFGWFV